MKQVEMTSRIVYAHRQLGEKRVYGPPLIFTQIEIQFKCSIYSSYTIILLRKYVCMSLSANYRSQFLLDRLGRYLKLSILTDIPSSHEFASQFGLAIFLSRRKTPKDYRVIARVISWPPATRRNGNNCCHRGDRLSQNGEKAISQNWDN